MTASARVMSQLAAGVPLSLLMDLAAPSGPDSTEIARRERVAALEPAYAAPTVVLAGERELVPSA